MDERGTQRPVRRARVLWHGPVAAAALALAGCTELGDEPVFVALPDAAPVCGPPEADYAWLSSCLFGPRCTGCHGGAIPAAPMSLERDRAHATLVGVESTLCPGAIRVVAGDPAASYLVEKLAAKAEGRAVVCPGDPARGLDPMPAAGAALTTAELDAVRMWIAGGAAQE